MKLRLFVVLSILFLLTACADPRTFSFSTIEQHYLNGLTPTTIAGDADGTTVRQSFMPTHDGLHRLALTWNIATPATAGQTTLRLLDDSQQVVYETSISLSDIRDKEPRLLLFEPQPDSALRVYTVEVELPESVTLAADGEERYNGRLSVEGAYQSGDLQLEWGYKPTIGILAQDVLAVVQKWGIPFFINAWVWTLPGLAVLTWMRRGESEAWSIPMLIGAAWAIGGALLVLLPMVAWWVGLSLGTWAVWVLLIVSGIAVAVAWRRGHPFGPLEPMGGTAWLYFGILALVFLSRIVVIHPFNSPLWGDSVHHTLITQLLLDNGGIFDTYEPYLPLAPFTYHAGFHLLCAWLGWSVLPGQSVLSGMDATLIGGQWQNVMAVTMVGLLTEGLLRRTGRTASASVGGVIALLVAGLLSHQPAFYVFWGRYTQLAGQIFLAPALLWSFNAWHTRSRWRWVLITVLMVSALALTHYRVLILYAAALPLLVIAVLWEERGRARVAWRSVAARMVASGAATVAIILPWYWKLQESVILQRTQVILSPSSLRSDYIATSNPFGDITQYVPEWFWLAALVSLLVLLWQRHRVGWLIGGWVVLCFLVANPGWLRLPGTGLVDNFMLQIALYLPLAVLVGAGVATFWQKGETVTHPPTPSREGALELNTPSVRGVSAYRLPLSAFYLLIFALASWGLWQQVQLADVRWYSFLTGSDWKAAQWIEANTPVDSRFHVNGFFAYYDTTVAGSDGGEWLPLIAGRDTTVPPMIYAHEAGIDPDYRADTNERYRRLENAESEPEALAAALKDEGVEYVYIGGQQGMVGKPLDDTPMNPLLLAESSAFETVYTDEFVWIFRVR